MLKQLEVALESLAPLRQIGVHGIGNPGADSRQQGTGIADAAVSRVVRLEVKKAAIRVFERHRGAWRPTENDDQFALCAGQVRLPLRVEPAAKGHSRVEHLLLGNAPFQQIQLRFQAVPQAPEPHPFEIRLREPVPCRLLRQVQRRIEQPCLQLEESGKAGHQDT